MNTIAVYGRVASDVTTKNVNGRTCANFRFASNNKHKEADGKYGTNFYNVSVWGATGETVAKFLKKGHRAAITGELVIRQYVGNDQLNHQAVEINANSVDFVETRSEVESKANNAVAAAPAQSFPEINTDEPPF